MSKQEKRISVGLVVCFVAMIAIVGVLTFNQYQKRLGEDELARLQEIEERHEQELETENLETQTTNTEQIQAEIQPSVADQIELEGYEGAATSEVLANIQPEVLTFSANEVLDWPIEGNVILNYSMDQSIYFSTLDQYKYNPAIVISGKVGDEVRAAATGKVISVKEEAQTGMTVTMDLGSGYQMVIGQLDGVRVEEGKTVNKGELIGYVAEPSKYYVVEGPNVYFQMLKDGEPVNPLEYIGV